MLQHSLYVELFPPEGPIMSQFHQLLSHIQADSRISDDEAALIGEYLVADGAVDIDDVKLLVELYCHTETRCPAFDKLFFTTLEGVFLTDGQVTPSEEFYLLKMLYSDREVSQPERDFLQKLRQQVPHKSASFEALIESALSTCGN
jgi:hypothetical protein